MSKCLLCAGAALLLAGWAVSAGAAKPPDLPVKYTDNFAPVGGATSDDACPSTPDTPCPEQGARLAGPFPTDAASASDTSADIAQLLSARRLYRVGRRCLRQGDLDMASSCFHEVQLLAPASRYSQLALDQLNEINEQRTASEEEESIEGASASTDKDQQAGRDHTARHLYRVAERCQRSGELDMALGCYHEVALMCPGSALARRAGRRIKEVEALRDAAEACELAQEEPAPGDALPEDACTKTRCPTSKPVGAPMTPAWKKKLLRQKVAGETTLQQREEETSSPTRPEQKSSRGCGSTPSAPLYVSPAPTRLIIEQP